MFYSGGYLCCCFSSLQISTSVNNSLVLFSAYRKGEGEVAGELNNEPILYLVHMHLKNEGKFTFICFGFSLKIAQIAKILNAHMNSLQWIDQNSGKLVAISPYYQTPMGGLDPCLGIRVPLRV